jgi:DNA-binding PadR family transcriptional regulator
MTDLVLLAMLLGGPKHGYQLKHEAGLVLGQRVLHDNLVYPLLRRFTNKKWVNRKEVPGERGQTRQQYSLRALGRRELVARLSEFSERDAASWDAFRFRVSMFWLLEPEVCERVLKARAEFLQAQTVQMNAIQRGFELNRYATEVTNQTLARIRSELAWIERLHKLEKSRKGKPGDYGDGV